MEIDVLSGNVLLDHLTILPLGEMDFLLAAGQFFTNKNNYPVELGLTSYTNGDVKFGSSFFQLEIWFRDSNLEMLSMDWLGGITKEKGWNSSDSDLIHDKNSLTRLVRKMVGKNPERMDEYEDLFEFEWGLIFVHCVRKAMYAKIDITWS